MSTPTVSAGWKCICGLVNPKDADTCRRCGAWPGAPPSASTAALACPKCGNPSGPSSAFCDKCGMPLGRNVARATSGGPAPCARCGGDTILESERPNLGLGWALIVVGCVLCIGAWLFSGLFWLAFLVLGIVLVIAGANFTSNARHRRHCRGCGAMLPA